VFRVKSKMNSIKLSSRQALYCDSSKPKTNLSKFSSCHAHVVLSFHIICTYCEFLYILWFVFVIYSVGKTSPYAHDQSFILWFKFKKKKISVDTTLDMYILWYLFI